MDASAAVDLDLLTLLRAPAADPLGRRKRHRVPAQSVIRVQSLAGDDAPPVQVQLTDVSSRGIAWRAALPVKAGQRYAAFVPVGPRACRVLLCEVRYCSRKGGQFHVGADVQDARSSAAGNRIPESWRE